MNEDVRKGVLLVLADGTVLYSDNLTDRRHHDDILRGMLLEKEVIPESYKKLTSRDDKLGYESSSLGLEAMMAAGNGMIVMFLVYDNNVKYNHAIVYLPETFTNEQSISFATFLNTVHSKEPVHDYYVGTVSKGKTYEEIDNTEYRPDYTDEFMFNSFEDFIAYIEVYNNNLQR